MKLPDVLKKAVLEQDWSIICKTYTILTGEPLEVPKPKEIDYATLDISLDVEYDARTAESPVSEKPRRGRPKKVHNVVQPTASLKEKAGDPPPLPESPVLIFPNGKPNRFSDSGELFPEERVSVNPKMGVANSQRRTNLDKRGSSEDGPVDTSKKIAVQCCLCGAEEEVVSQLAWGFVPKAKETEETPNTYKCTVCCSPRGREALLRSGALDKKR